MLREERLSKLSQKELEELLKKDKEELEDLNLEWTMNFSLTGVHLNPGERERLKARLEREKKSIEERMEKIEAALKKSVGYD